MRCCATSPFISSSACGCERRCWLFIPAMISDASWLSRPCILQCVEVLQCVAVCCSATLCRAVLLSVAVCCSVIQYVAVSWLAKADSQEHIGALFAVCHSVLLSVAACCRILQCVAVYCNVVVLHTATRALHIFLSPKSTMQHTATNCNTPQRTATHCIALQCTTWRDMCIWLLSRSLLPFLTKDSRKFARKRPFLPRWPSTKRLISEGGTTMGGQRGKREMWAGWERKLSWRNVRSLTTTLNLSFSLGTCLPLLTPNPLELP